MIRSIAFAGLLVLFGACKKGGDINSQCEDNFAHGEKDDGKWSPGKGDKAKFMDYCKQQKAEVVKCSSMEVDMFDKDCENVTGIRSDGFKVKMKIAALRNGSPVPE